MEYNIIPVKFLNFKKHYIIPVIILNPFIEHKIKPVKIIYYKIHKIIPVKI